MTTNRSLTLAGAVLVLVLGASPSRAEETSAEIAASLPAGPAKVNVVGPDGTPATAAPAPRSDVQNYCSNIADPALDQRNALQLARLKDAETQVSAKIDELEAKRQEVQSWLADRKAFMDSTSDIMISIYSGMKPDAAASQLAGLDRPVAAALLARLKSRQASAILAEMPAPIAAEISRVIIEKTDRSSLAGAAPKGQTL
ncbi:MAG: MotE family protein [Burkholderiales bacterium]